VGFDHERSLGKGETGSRAASPIWLRYMKEAVKGTPVKDFPIPDGIVFAKIDEKTGLPPTPRSKDIIFECFKKGTEPKPVGEKGEGISPGDFFRYQFER